MKAFRIFLLLFALGLLTACEKDPDTQKPPTQNPDPEPKPDLPCLGYFECDINGEPFETWGGPGCYSTYLSYDSIQNKLHTSGFDCRIKRNGIWGVVFTGVGISDTGKYPLATANCGYRDSTGKTVHINSLISGSIHITGLIKSNYSDDWGGGYIEGYFSFRVFNEDIHDTVEISNGQFCGRL